MSTIATPRPLTRHLQAVVAERLSEEAVIVLSGARTVGKSTLLRACAAALGTTVLDLDEPDTRAAVARDVGYYVAADAPEPVCIDEFQHVLPLLAAIKAELNRDTHPGRYLLTGSTRYTTLPAASQSLAGRVHLLTMWPLSQGELNGSKETFLDTLMSNPAKLVARRPSPTRRSQYEAIILAGGFPMAIERPDGQGRSRWFRDFVSTVVQRDVLEIRRVRQRELLPRVLRHLAAQTAQVLNVSRIAEAMTVRSELVADYTQLLEAVFLVHRLEAFGRTLSSAVRHYPKVHLVDSGLGGHLLGVTPARLLQRDAATLTEFGHLVETFAVNEIIKQSGWASLPVSFSHYRTRDGAEVDLVIEGEDGRVGAVEVKAAGASADTDFRGLRQLRAGLGDRFVGGVVLHLGERSNPHEDRLYSVPLDRLWS